MHIKDLKVDVELDGAALAAIRGGSYSENTEVSYGTSSCSCTSEPQPPQSGPPKFDGDWEQFPAYVQHYIGHAKSEHEVPSLGSDPLGGPY